MKSSRKHWQRHSCGKGTQALEKAQLWKRLALEKAQELWKRHRSFRKSRGALEKAHKALEKAQELWKRLIGKGTGILEKAHKALEKAKRFTRLWKKPNV